jgi:hypothetical protein
MTATPPQERSSRPRPAKPSPQVRERANEGPRAPLRRSPDEDRDCAIDHEGAGYHEALARDLAPELFAEVAPTPGDDTEATAEHELLRQCCVHAKDAAWAQWFYEEVYSRPGGKAAALAFYRAWESTQQGGAA